MNKKASRSPGVIASILRPVLALFVLSFLFLMLSIGFNTLIPQVIRIAMDTLASGRPEGVPDAVMRLFRLDYFLSRPGMAPWLCAGAVLLSAALSGLCRFVYQLSAAKSSESAIKSLRDRLFAHIQRLPYLWHTQNQTGDIIQRCTSDVDVIRNFVSLQLLEAIRITILVTFTSVVMFTMNWKISLVATSSYNEFTVFLTRAPYENLLSCDGSGIMSVTGRGRRTSSLK